MENAVIQTKSSPFSSVWLVPLVAVVAGLWMAASAYINEGPEITVTFASGEGLKAGETRVKRLSVELGVVKEVYLNDSYDMVTAVIKFHGGTEELLSSDTQFWVVRPRIGAAGVSGLGALLSGAYIELAPGELKDDAREYRGLDDMPITDKSAAGASLAVVAERSGSISVASPVLYNGYRVGRVEKVALSPIDKRVHYQIFIEAPYDELVSSNTRFWNSSGVNVTAGSNGISVQTESLEALLSGGITFGLPEHTKPGKPLSELDELDKIFDLYTSLEEMNKQPYAWGREYLLMFDSSVRGLSAGAPVEYRGIRVGTVLKVSLDLIDEKFAAAQSRLQIPVLIRVDPGRFGVDSKESMNEMDDSMGDGVNHGLRASLASGNLLTGSLYVSLDYYDDVEAAEFGKLNGHTLFPTTASGLGHIQGQISSLLSKLQDLPIEKALGSADSALQAVGETAKSADATLAGISSLLNSAEAKSLPLELKNSLQSLQATLAGLSPQSAIYQDVQFSLQELRETLNNTKDLTQKLEDRPNQLIFSQDPEPDPIPGG